MMSEKTKRWINAGKAIAINGREKIICPECESDYLDIRDISDKHYAPHVERMMICPNCGARNYLRMKK